MPSAPNRRPLSAALPWLLLPAASLCAAAPPALPDPQLRYRAVFPGSPASDPAPADWRDSNRLMLQLGGHQTGQAAATPAPPPAPTAAAHTDHGAAAAPTKPASAAPTMAPMHHHRGGAMKPSAGAAGAKP